MELATTFRGLNPMECGTATRALERSSARLDRLLDKPTLLKVVVDGSPPEYRVMLSMGMRGTDLTSEDAGHDLANVVASAAPSRPKDGISSRFSTRFNPAPIPTEIALGTDFLAMLQPNTAIKRAPFSRVPNASRATVVAAG